MLVVNEDGTSGMDTSGTKASAWALPALTNIGEFSVSWSVNSKFINVRYKKISSRSSTTTIVRNDKEYVWESSVLFARSTGKTMESGSANECTFGNVSWSDLFPEERPTKVTI